MRQGFLGAVLGLLLLAPAAYAQPDADSALTDAIARSILSYPKFTIFDDVTVQADAHVVVLGGKVTMPFKRDEIGRRAAALAGARMVRNEIEVLPVSIHDDELRRRVARAIYGDPAFWRYAAMANPPIHIVVEHGRVTLTGVVPTEVDRLLARSLASGRGEVALVNALQIK